MNNKSKIYSRCSLSKISNEIGMHKDLLMKYIKKLTYSREIYCKVNVKDDIIEFDTMEVSSQFKINQLKQAYESLNSIQSQMIDMSLHTK